LCSLFSYEGPVREAILAAKYAGRSDVALFVARALAEAVEGPWAACFRGGPPPVLVPVPLHPLKMLRRGYNVPALAARALARRLGWQAAPRLLVRVRPGPPQAGLPLAERPARVAGAFRAASAPVPPRIALLDDVVTSGATVAACAAALKAAGARHIVVLAMARTPAPAGSSWEPA